MASSTAPLQEWLVIVPDHVGALDKRLAVRQKHLEGIKSDRDDMWLWGGTSHATIPTIISTMPLAISTRQSLTVGIGAMLEEPIQEGASGPPKMKGSAVLIGAKTREEVVERLKKDVYVESGVWDLEKVQIIPFKSALRKAL
jgi:uncharacterized protein YciI